MDVNSNEAAEWTDLMRRNSALEHALKSLVRKLTEIEADKSFQGIWSYLHVHGYQYTGPDWRDALADARTALGSQ